MPGMIYQATGKALCPHGGQVTTTPSGAKVLVGNQPVATLTAQSMVAACVFTVPPSKPQPCVRVQWMAGALKVTASGSPVLIQTATGLCQSAEQIPQGPATIVSTQMKVSAT